MHKRVIKQTTPYTTVRQSSHCSDVLHDSTHALVHHPTPTPTRPPALLPHTLTHALPTHTWHTHTHGTHGTHGTHRVSFLVKTRSRKRTPSRLSSPSGGRGTVNWSTSRSSNPPSSPRSKAKPSAFKSDPGRATWTSTSTMSTTVVGPTTAVLVPVRGAQAAECVLLVVLRVCGAVRCVVWNCGASGSGSSSGSGSGSGRGRAWETPPNPLPPFFTSGMCRTRSN